MFQISKLRNAGETARQGNIKNFKTKTSKQVCYRSDIVIPETSARADLKKMTQCLKKWRVNGKKENTLNCSRSLLVKKKLSHIILF